jgi:hypothetical protein
MIMGDFNLGDINLDLHEGSGEKAGKFLKCIQNNFLYQHVHEITHKEGNILLLYIKNFIEINS